MLPQSTSTHCDCFIALGSLEKNRDRCFTFFHGWTLSFFFVDGKEVTLTQQKMNPLVACQALDCKRKKHLIDFCGLTFCRKHLKDVQFLRHCLHQSDLDLFTPYTLDHALIELVALQFQKDLLKTSLPGTEDRIRAIRQWMSALNATLGFVKQVAQEPSQKAEVATDVSPVPVPLCATATNNTEEQARSTPVQKEVSKHGNQVHGKQRTIDLSTQYVLHPGTIKNGMPIVSRRNYPSIILDDSHRPKQAIMTAWKPKDAKKAETVKTVAPAYLQHKKPSSPTFKVFKKKKHPQKKMNNSFFRNKTQDQPSYASVVNKNE